MAEALLPRFGQVIVDIAVHSDPLPRCFSIHVVVAGGVGTLTVHYRLTAAMPGRWLVVVLLLSQSDYRIDTKTKVVIHFLVSDSFSKNCVYHTVHSPGVGG